MSPTKTRAEIIAELIRTAHDHGIDILIFETRDEMNQLIDDMRTGATVRAAYRDAGVAPPRPYLM